MQLNHVPMDDLPQSPNSLTSSASNVNSSFIFQPPDPDPYTDDTIDADTSRPPMDLGLTAHNPETGRTDLHFLNDIIY